LSKAIDIKTIKQKRNFDSDSDDNFNSHGVIINEWEMLEAIYYSINNSYLYYNPLKLIMSFFYINLRYFIYFLNSFNFLINKIKLNYIQNL